MNVGLIGTGYWGKNLLRDFNFFGVLKSVSDVNLKAKNEVSKISNITCAPISWALSEDRAPLKFPIGDLFAPTITTLVIFPPPRNLSFLKKLGTKKIITTSNLNKVKFCEGYPINSTDYIDAVIL